MYANLGNVDTYIAARHSVPDDGQVFDTSGEINGEAEPLTAEERKRLFKRRRLSSVTGAGNNFTRHDLRGVMLLSRSEIASLFGDIVEGLAFLVRMASGSDGQFTYSSLGSQALERYCPPRSEMPKHSASPLRGRPHASFRAMTRSATEVLIPACYAQSHLHDFRFREFPRRLPI
jgi:hypothetical protein